MTVAAHRMNNALRYRAQNAPEQTQFTPKYVLDLVRMDLALACRTPSFIAAGIWCDPCTTADNPVGADLFYTVESNGLTKPWHSEVGPIGAQTVFCNPPYGKAREPWVERCIEAGKRGQPVVLLIPAATDTRIWQLAATTAKSIVFVKGRVKFGVLRPNRRQVAASHPSSLIGWNTDLACCSKLGFRVAKPEIVTRRAA